MHSVSTGRAIVLSWVAQSKMLRATLRFFFGAQHFIAPKKKMNSG
jgi:hypothetical protein